MHFDKSEYPAAAGTGLPRGPKTWYCFSVGRSDTCRSAANSFRQKQTEPMYSPSLTLLPLDWRYTANL